MSKFDQPGMFSELKILVQFMGRDHIEKLRQANEQAMKAIAERGPTMTARELLQRLQALDERSLNTGVYVRPAPPGGGYASIRDVSVIHIGGPAIIHLAEPLPDIDSGKEDSGS